MDPERINCSVHSKVFTDAELRGLHRAQADEQRLLVDRVAALKSVFDLGPMLVLN